MSIADDKNFLLEYMYKNQIAFAVNRLTVNLRKREGIVLNTPLAILFRKLVREKLVDVLDTRYSWKMYKISYDGIEKFENKKQIQKRPFRVDVLREAYHKKGPLSKKAITKLAEQYGFDADSMIRFYYRDFKKISSTKK